MEIRTRFAPSPTGYLHVGAIRTALYAFLFAKKNNGKFILRIEDTDKIRSTKKSIQTILQGMQWLNLTWDEGPYFQSKRMDRYNQVINQMLIEGSAYKCFCSINRLNKLRALQIKQGKKPQYDGYCRRKNINSNNFSTSYTIRFRNPQEGSVVFHDQIYGVIKFNNKELDDLIICRMNGLPTYNFCVVIDDADMKITHVIRGDDHINNTPRQINIMRALRMSIPQYAHLPMILNDAGKKLSKRHEVINIMQYHDDGFLPEALLNHLVRLGWSYGNQEIFSLEQMKKYFNLNSVNKSSSIFNINKLIWYNRYYINHLPVNYIANNLEWYIKKHKIDVSDGPQLTEIIKLFSTRCNTLKEIVNCCKYIYQDINEFNTDIANKYLKTMSFKPLTKFRERLVKITTWTSKYIHQEIVNTAHEIGVEIKMVQMPLRVAITGVDKSPAINVIIHIIGQLRTIRRIDKALDYINN